MAHVNSHKVVELARENIRFLSWLQSAVKKDSFRKSLSKHGLDVKVTGSFLNPGTLVGFAYIGLVWLREVDRDDYKRKIKNVPLDEVGGFLREDLSSTVKKWDRKEGETLLPYLESIRNALSHGRVEFCEENYLILTDKKDGKGETHTEIKIQAQLLGQLTSQVVSWILDGNEHTSEGEAQLRLPS